MRKRLPRKHEILSRAEELAMQRQVIGMGVEPITPTEAELKESGVYREARLELMSGQASGALAEQHRYVSAMASELNLKVLRQKEWMGFQKERKLLRRERAMRRWHIRGLSTLLGTKAKAVVVVRSQKRHAPKPKPIIPRVPKIPTVTAILKPKKHRKRQKLQTQRNGITMRKLRKRMKNGVTSFSFPDNIWKVRKI